MFSSSTKKTKPLINQQNRRHSLRLISPVKETKLATVRETSKRKKTSLLNKIIVFLLVLKWRKVENDKDDENSSTNNDNDNDDDYDDLVARHQRLMLEEQKDRKLYERYIRDQRVLRRMKCRRTHSAHLTEATKNRLLHELEHERRYTIHDKICGYRMSN